MKPTPSTDAWAFYESCRHTHTHTPPHYASLSSRATIARPSLELNPDITRVPRRDNISKLFSALNPALDALAESQNKTSQGSCHSSTRKPHATITTT